MIGSQGVLPARNQILHGRKKEPREEHAGLHYRPDPPRTNLSNRSVVPLARHPLQRSMHYYVVPRRQIRQQAWRLHTRLNSQVVARR